MRLEIPEPTPSLNTMLRQHWSIDRKLKKRWDMLVWVARLQANDNCLPLPLPIPLDRAKITITRYSKSMLDPDNALGGTKHLIDSLKTQGLIADDTPEHIKVEMRQEKGDPRTVVELEAA